MGPPLAFAMGPPLKTQWRKATLRNQTGPNSMPKVQKEPSLI